MRDAEQHPVALGWAVGVAGLHYALAAFQAMQACGFDSALALGFGLGQLQAATAQVARPTDASRRATRRAAYSSGVLTPRPRETVADRLRAELSRWGLDRKAVA